MSPRRLLVFLKLVPCATLALGLAFVCSVRLSADEKPSAALEKKISVLTVTFPQGARHVDFPSRRKFAEAGLQMDYLERPDDLKWDVVKNYNVLVFTHFYDPYGKTMSDSDFTKETLALIDRFLKAGGGVWIFPNLDSAGDNAPVMRTLQTGTWDQYGVRSLFQQWIQDDGLVSAGNTPHNHYAYTDNFADHPITRGLKGIWYPVDHMGRRIPSTSAIEVDQSKGWKVILSGSYLFTEGLRFCATSFGGSRSRQGAACLYVHGFHIPFGGRLQHGVGWHHDGWERVKWHSQ